MCLGSLEGSQKTANWAWNRVCGGAGRRRGKVSQKSLKWSRMCVRRRPEFTHHPRSRDGEGWPRSEVAETPPPLSGNKEQGRWRHPSFTPNVENGPRSHRSHPVTVGWCDWGGLCGNCHVGWRHRSVTARNDGCVARDGLRFCLSHLE